MPGIFLGLKFQACVFFWVCNMKLRRTPPSCILRVPPWEACIHVHFSILLIINCSLYCRIAEAVKKGFNKRDRGENDILFSKKGEVGIGRWATSYSNKGRERTILFQQQRSEGRASGLLP